MAEDRGHLPDAGALRLSPCLCPSRRDGWPVNPKRICRLYKEMDLQLGNKVPKRRVKAKLLGDGFRSQPVGYRPQHQGFDSRRYFLALLAGSRHPLQLQRRRGGVQTLERVCRQVGYPASIRVENGSKFISRDLDLRAGLPQGRGARLLAGWQANRQQLHREFQRQIRAECLNAQWFISLDDARLKMDWRRDYNEFRPRSAISNKVSISLINGSSAAPPD